MGRPKGAINRVSYKAKLLAAELGETPVEYMLRVMNDPTVPDSRRDEMAKAAANYISPKLASVVHSGTPDAPIEVADVTNRQLAMAVVQLLAQAGLAEIVDQEAIN